MKGEKKVLINMIFKGNSLKLVLILGDMIISKSDMVNDNMII